MEYYLIGIEYIIKFKIKYSTEKGEMLMSTEIKELNRMICKQCDEKDYEKCRSCKVYQLVNKIATR